MKKALCTYVRQIFFVFAFVSLSSTVFSQTFWYYRGTGSLDDVNSWSSNENGIGGTSPANFTTDNNQYVIRNTTAVALSAVWTVSGTGSRVVLGSTAAPAVTLTLNAGSQIVVPTQSFDVVVPSSGTPKIVYKNSNPLSLSTTVDPNTELVFDGTTAMTVSSSRTFGNVSLINNAEVNMGSASLLLANLTVDEGSVLAGPIGASGNYIGVKAGGSVVINGTFRAGRTGSVASGAPGALYSVGISFSPYVSATTHATILFNDATNPPNITLGANSTIDYYRGTSGQTGTQGISPLTYANLTLSNRDAFVSQKTFAEGTINVRGTLTVNLYNTTPGSNAFSATPGAAVTLNLLPGARLVVNSPNTLNLGGRLFLRSDATGTASIGTLVANAAITGNVTVEQYIPGGFRKYRFLSHPFTTSQPLSQIADDIDITGNTAGTTGLPGQTVGSGFTATATNNPSAFFFTTANADGGSPTDAGWTAFTDATTSSWARSQGIRVLVRGPKSQPGTLDGTNATPNPVTLNMAGTINTGNVAVNLVTGGSGSTAGFNFVGNPYPSPVDIGAVLTAATNIGTTFYLRNPQTGSYITVNPIPANYVMPAYSAFFVRATAATSLNFTEANKATCISCATVFRTNSLRNRFHFKVTQNNLEYDNFFINLGDDYDKNYEEKYDAPKLMNDGLSIYVLSNDNKRLAADYRSINRNDTISLGIAIPTSMGNQTYTIELADLNLDNNTSAVLLDKLTNTEIKLESNTQYNFNVNATNAASIGNDRFKIILTKKPNIPAIQNEEKGIDVRVTKEAILITNNTGNNLQQSDVVVTGINGARFATRTITLDNGNTIAIPFSQANTGIYAVSVITNNGNVVKKVFKP